ncbi:hypothetical protein [uncultured Tenacibaculum sp.]|uniref:hypothetical protein n=1 Tax=uncultured Tenacibaculum sp. TaxID=174713 RepID=UPI00260600CA|nr:hypothetical protein [uncultured Tenacibaculum sp.]
MENYKFNKHDLYKATNQGLDIIHKYFPESIGCESSSSKKFKFRQTEKTASASLFYAPNKIWYIKDFGDKSYDALSSVINLKGLDFKQVLHRLYSEFQVPISSKIYTPNIEFKENKELLPLSHFKIITKEYSNLNIVGRFINNEIAKNYNFFEVDFYEKITKKERKLMITKSSDYYPIFAYSNNLEKWAKTYKPQEFKHKNKDGKTVNYKHGYLGTKDNEYIHGLDRILNDVDEEQISYLFEDLKRTNTSLTKKDILNEIKELQVKNIIICSGGSDGLNLASISNDYYPIWLNSEGQQLTYSQYQRINKLCQNFYNLPDIDNSGKKYAYSLANQYWNIKTIWLPESKMGDNGKDFRDWLKYYQYSDKETIKRQFDKLMLVALKCNFIDSNDKGRPQINLSNLHYFLNANNYHGYRQNLNIQEKSNEDTSFLVKVEDYKVAVPETSEIRKFCIDYLIDKGACLDKINLIKRSRAFSTAELKNIDKKDLNFTNCNASYQLFYFKNGIVTVTKNGVVFSTQNTLNKYVWKHKVVNKNFEVLNHFFNYYKDDKGNNRVKILDTSCDFMSYLINGSRVYWRKEIELQFNTKAERENYRSNNRFTLNGKYLSEEEQITQEQHFLNKCFALGYLIHRYKREDFAKFVYIMDDTVKESDDDANGGTGKSLSIRGLKELLNIFTIDGKDDNLSSNKHLLGGLQKEHDIINIEDGKKGGAFDFFYNKITGEVEVNPKGKQGYSLSFAESPKFVGTFNYGLNKNRGSDLRRLFFVSFGDYYHAHTDNFNEERKVSDDFGYSFFQDWDDKQYNKFYNFLMQCCQLYLSNIRNEFKAPMNNILLNNLKAQIGDNCIEWATEYFSDEEHFNKNILRSDLYSNYVDFVGKKSALGARKFKTAVEKFCKMEGYVFNPKNLKDSQGRIMINQILPGTQKRVKKECFYIKNENYVESYNINIDEIEH